MNEDEIKAAQPSAAEDVAPAVAKDPEKDVIDENDEPEEDELPEEETSVPTEDDERTDQTDDDGGAPLTDAQCRRVLSNPMFYAYAKGRAGSMDELIKGFSEMIALGGAQPSGAQMRSTPTVRPAKAEYALSERQKSIARDAGMSYREYYSFLKSMR